MAQESASAVDLGLSVKWCFCNVGVHAPGETGVYFTWEQAQRIRSEQCFLPTKKHFEDLINKCKWEWTKEYGRGGYKITGPNGNSIFLPACGQTCGPIKDENQTFGYYWSSNDKDNTTAWGLGFVDPSWHVEPGVQDYNKINGKSIRMVCF